MRSVPKQTKVEMAILSPMKLIYSPTSPYVRKVRIVFLEKEVDIDLESNSVWAADTNIGTYNPLGKVPCLVLDDGEAIQDSRVIAEYADALSPVSKLIPADHRERATVKTWEQNAVDQLASQQDLQLPLQGGTAQRPNQGQRHADTCNKQQQLL